MTENTRSRDDDCYIKSREKSNYDRLKFRTTSFTDLIDAQKTGSYFGSTSRNALAVPADKIDTYSQLVNGVRGDYNSKCYTYRGTSNPLPLPTYPTKINTAHGNIDTEDNNLRGNELREINPIRYVPEYQDRTFGIFEGITKPSNVVENTSRNGQQTRF